MSPDSHALEAQIREATRTIEIATAHIHELNSRLHDLEIENQRLRGRLIDLTELNKLIEQVQTDNHNLRARLNTTQERLRRMTEGEL